MNKIKFLTLAGLTLVWAGVVPTMVVAAESTKIHDHHFSFEGPFGTFDQAQLQRGMQIYQEVCGACHGLRHVAFRNLGDVGGPQLTSEQVKAFAALYDIYDAEEDDSFPAKPADHFPTSGVEGAPDLSLITKARSGFSGPYGLGITPLFKGLGGPEYVLAYLTGYTGKEKEQAGQILFENKAFAGNWTAMSPPLEDGQVEFSDGSKNDIEHMSEDVTAFLMWTAEPKMMARKKVGFLAVIMLGLLSVLLYLSNKKLWMPHKSKHY